MKLIFDGNILPQRELLKRMEEGAKLALEHVKLSVDNVEISVSFVSEKEIKSMNREFRQRDSVTDVLSFPQFENIDSMSNKKIVVLGDVVICEEKAKKQAIEFNHSYEREIIYLFIHSIFHLLGYDHIKEDDRIKMRTAEDKIMDELDIKRM